MIKRFFTLALPVFILSACASTPNASLPDPVAAGSSGLALPDKAHFLQQDPRWAGEQLGWSADTLGSDGCLVTAVSMALVNLGFDTNPSDLNHRLTRTKSFTDQGWLVWSGVSKVTEGAAKARFHTEVDDQIIASCMLDGYYPLVRFDNLPNGRSHWAMIVRRSAEGYHMRDPLRPSTKPLIFPGNADHFRAVRCVGQAAA